LWADKEEKPVSLEATLKSDFFQVRQACYPNLCRLLLLLPVTLATVERANSALGFIKSARRNAMVQDRMNALLLLFCHSNIA